VSGSTVVALAFVVLLVLLFMKVPVFVSILSASALYFVMMPNMNIAIFAQKAIGGIESIPKGQYEAAQVLGMTKTQIFFKVILLQVVKRIVAPMSNEIITLVKDTSLARVIAVKEIIMVAQEYVTARALIWPLFYSGAFYLIFCGILTILFSRIEKRLDYFRV